MQEFALGRAKSYTVVQVSCPFTLPV